MNIEIHSKPGYSLVELTAVVSITLILAVFVMAGRGDRWYDAQFEAFVAELEAHLFLARRQAQITEVPVDIDFREHEDYRYALIQDDGVARDFVSSSSWGKGYRRGIRNDLSGVNLLHPTSGAPITQALRSTHAPLMIFGADGSSSGTVVFGDGRGRVVCAVVSGSSGRIRMFVWRKNGHRWLPR